MKIENCGPFLEMGCHTMPRGPVILKIGERLKEKEGLDDGRVEGFGQQNNIKFSTHLMVGNTEWYFSKVIMVSATLPWIPPAMVRPSMATCCTYTPSFQKTQMYFLCVGQMGELW